MILTQIDRIGIIRTFGDYTIWVQSIRSYNVPHSWLSYCSYCYSLCEVILAFNSGVGICIHSGFIFIYIVAFNFDYFVCFFGQDHNKKFSSYFFGTMCKYCILSYCSYCKYDGGSMERILPHNFQRSIGLEQIPHTVHAWTFKLRHYPNGSDVPLLFEMSNMNKTLSDWTSCWSYFCSPPNTWGEFWHLV